jgi:hypothetical protein
MSSDSDPSSKDLGGVAKRTRKSGPWGRKPWRDAVNRAAHRRDPVTGTRYLEMAAAALVRQAVSGDNVSLKELGDRLDGRVNPSASDGGARVSFVVHMPAPLQPDAWARSAGAKPITPDILVPPHTLVDMADPGQQADFGDGIGDGEGERVRLPRS